MLVIKIVFIILKKVLQIGEIVINAFMVRGENFQAKNLKIRQKSTTIEYYFSQKELLAPNLAPMIKCKLLSIISMIGIRNDLTADLAGIGIGYGKLNC